MELFTKVLSYFWRKSNSINMTLDEAYEILFEKPDECDDGEFDNKGSTEDDFIEKYESVVKTGVITSKSGTKYVINNAYSFDSEAEHFFVGSKVSFTLIPFRGKINVINVSIIENDWSVVEDKRVTWCVRTVLCKVERREVRKLYLYPDDIIIDLNSVCSEFIPQVGDWVELDVKCEIDETVANLKGNIIEVSKIRPLRQQIKIGVITFWNSDDLNGCIDKTIYFTNESLLNGYVPEMGDKVIAEILESDQGRYTWRALKVIPEYLISKNEITRNDYETDFELDHENVDVSSNLFVKFQKLGESSTFNVEVKNKTPNNITLTKIIFPKENGPFEFLNGDNTGDNIEITSDNFKTFTFKCTAKNIGNTRELILFKFSDFVIGRWVDITVESSTNYKHNTHFNRSQRYKPKKEKDYVRGERPCSSIRFIKVQIPIFSIPNKFLKSVSAFNESDNKFYENLRCLKPSLFKDLSFFNYEDRFHSLLYLDEIAYLNALSIYDLPAACFIKNGEYLMLEIENLNEKRPSIVIGDKIMATDANAVGSLTYEGFVYRVGAKHVYLKFKQDFHNLYNGEDYSVSVVSSRTVYRRLHYGVSMAVKTLGEKLLFPSRVEETKPQINLEVLFSYINDNKKPMPSDINNKVNNDSSTDERDVKDKISSTRETLEKILLHKTSKLLLAEVNENPDNLQLQPEENKVDEVNETAINSQLKPEENKPIEFEWYNPQLNFYQKEAIKNILKGVARPLPYIVFGPPGTGKTVTLVETILQILRLISHCRLLVAAPSNSACDLLAMKLIQSGVLKPGDLIRLVSINHISSNLIPVELVPYCASPNIAAEGTHVKDITVTDNGLALDCTSAVIGRHRITVTTCSSAGLLHQMGFLRGHFSHIFIDEASQSSEPEVMLPLSFLNPYSGQIVLAGDPLQLGPTILSKHAEELGLAESYQERLINRFPYLCDLQGFPETGGYDPRLVTKLLYNYRSLPPLLKIYSSMFYGNDLIPTLSLEDSKESEILRSLKTILPSTKDGQVPAVVFHGVSGENYQMADSPSWFNPDEISQVFFYVNEMYRLGLSKADIGIISPYKKQVMEIRSVLSEAEFDVPKVGSVEEFQGQEFNVILLSTVRSKGAFVHKDLACNLGFVANPRRLNVGISRAKCLLIIIGNPNLLATDVHWKSVIKYCFDHGGYTGCDFTY